MIPIKALDHRPVFEQELVSMLGRHTYHGGQRTQRVACHYNWHTGWFSVRVVMRCGVQFHFNATETGSVQDQFESFTEYADHRLKEWLTPRQSV